MLLLEGQMKVVAGASEKLRYLRDELAPLAAY